MVMVEQIFAIDPILEFNAFWQTDPGGISAHRFLLTYVLMALLHMESVMMQIITTPSAMPT
jgi:hypothetical protein